MRVRGAAAAPLVELYKISQRALRHNIDNRPPRRHARHTRKGNIFTSIMVHGAVVYARHNAPEKEEGDAVAAEEEG